MSTLPAPGAFALASLARDVERLEDDLTALQSEPKTEARCVRAVRLGTRAARLAGTIAATEERLTREVRPNGWQVSSGTARPVPLDRDRLEDLHAARRRLSYVVGDTLALCDPRSSEPETASSACFSAQLKGIAGALRNLYPDAKDPTDEELEAGAHAFAWEKDAFLEWAGRLAGWSKSEARRQLEASGLLVKGKRGVRAAGLAETIRNILRLTPV